MLAELREALRQLRKAPGITTTVVITLALGIGATTAIFTLVHQVMLKSLPVTSRRSCGRSETKSAAAIGAGTPKGTMEISRVLLGGVQALSRQYKRVR